MLREISYGAAPFSEGVRILERCLASSLQPLCNDCVELRLHMLSERLHRQNFHDTNHDMIGVVRIKRLALQCELADKPLPALNLLLDLCWDGIAITISEVPNLDCRPEASRFFNGVVGLVQEVLPGEFSILLRVTDHDAVVAPGRLAVAPLVNGTPFSQIFIECVETAVLEVAELLRHDRRGLLGACAVPCLGIDQNRLLAILHAVICIFHAFVFRFFLIVGG